MAQKKTNYSINPKDVAGSKLLVLLIMSFAYIFVLMFLYKYIADTKTILTGFLGIQIQFYVSIAFLAAAIVFFIIRVIKKTDEKLKVITKGNTLLTAIVFFIASALIFKYDVYAIKIMYVVIPVWFVLYLIYTSYVREFFFISLSSVFGSIVLYLVDKVVSYHTASKSIAGSLTYILGVLNSLYIPVIIVFLVIGVLFLLAVKKAQDNKGVLKLGKKEFVIASSHSRWLLMYIGIAIPMVFLIASFFYSQILIYGIYTIGVYFACMIVYYTYKLMNK